MSQQPAARAAVMNDVARLAGVSHTTVSHAFSSPKVPSWGTLELLVEVMDGDTPAFHDLWVAATTPADKQAIALAHADWSISALWVFMASYVVFAAITWAVYLRSSFAKELAPVPTLVPAGAA